MGSISIVAPGSATIDKIIPLELNPDLTPLVEKIIPKPGGKERIDHHRMLEITELVRDAQGLIQSPGGSAPNTLIAMKQLLGDSFSARLFTFLGVDDRSQILRDQLDRYAIRVEPGVAGIDRAKRETLKPSESFVFVYPDGDRRIANYPGTIREHIQDLVIRPELLNRADALMLFGSTHETFGVDIFNGLLRLAKTNQVPVLFSLPTNGQFLQDNGNYQDIWNTVLEHARVVACNMEELQNFTGADSGSIEDFRVHALKSAEMQFRVARRFRASEGLYPNITGFFTESLEGATVLSLQDGEVAVRPKKEIKKVNTLAAGDVTTGVFYAALAVGLNPATAASLAMTAGAITVEYMGTVPPNLAEEIAKRDTVNWRLFTEELRNLQRQTVAKF